MAERLNADDAAAAVGESAKDHEGVLYNAGARRQRIQQGFLNCSALDDQIAAAKEKYLKPLTEARKKEWKNLSADVNMPAADLKPDYMKFRRGREAVEFEEERETDAVFDNFAEIHDALHPGGDLNWPAAVAGDFAEYEWKGDDDDEETPTEEALAGGKQADDKPKKRGRKPKTEGEKPGKMQDAAGDLPLGEPEKADG